MKRDTILIGKSLLEYLTIYQLFHMEIIIVEKYGYQYTKIENEKHDRKKVSPRLFSDRPISI